jgi:hypothetical protein
MQFNIPQFIDVEDKIVGPLTLKQFFYLAGAGVFLFFIWYFFQFWVFLIFAIPIGGFALALAFVKINGRPLINYVTAFLNYMKKPRLYVWKKKN